MRQTAYIRHFVRSSPQRRRCGLGVGRSLAITICREAVRFRTRGLVGAEAGGGQVAGFQDRSGGRGASGFRGFRICRVTQGV